MNKAGVNLKPKRKSYFFEDAVLFLSLFTSSITFFTNPFEGYFHYLIFLFFIPIFVFRYGIPSILIKILAIPAFVGVFHLNAGNLETFDFLKIFVGFVLTISFYYYFLIHTSFDVKRLFELYIKFSYAILLIGVIQFASIQVGFKPGYDFGWILNKWGVHIGGGILGVRVNSILAEPSALAIVTSPAVLISINNLVFGEKYILKKKYQCIIVILGSILTASSTGYLGFMVSFALIAVKRNMAGLAIGLAASTIAFMIAYNTVDEFRGRVDAAVGIMESDDIDATTANTSSFVIYNNFVIASENFKRYPIFGTGLGSHRIAFSRYSLTKELGFQDFDFNATDANSLFIRMMSETGLVGLVWFGLILFRGGVSPKRGNRFLIFAGLLVLIVVTLLRQGNYFLNGLPFIVMLYYFNGIQAKGEDQIEEPVTKEIEA